MPRLYSQAILARLLANDFYENTLFAFAIEFAVKDLFPGAEVELAFGDGDDHFAAHDLALVVSVGVVFASAVVVVAFG